MEVFLGQGRENYRGESFCFSYAYYVSRLDSQERSIALSSTHIAIRIYTYSQL